MLDALSAGVIVFPGSGIPANLATRLATLGIPVWRITEDGADRRRFSTLLRSAQVKSDLGQEQTPTLMAIATEDERSHDADSEG
jgi:hypothetical protein